MYRNEKRATEHKGMVLWCTISDNKLMTMKRGTVVMYPDFALQLTTALAGEVHTIYLHS